MSELLSVIIPVYKVEQYLDQCVESVVNQTYCNLDIILVDDGSPDKCGAMCDAWAGKDSRIRVVHNQNERLGFARNSGIDVAKGEYFAMRFKMNKLLYYIFLINYALKGKKY